MQNGGPFTVAGLEFIAAGINASGPIKFMQTILDVANGNNRAAAGAVGVAAADNKNLLPKPASPWRFPGEVVDVALGQPANATFYPSHPNPYQPPAAAGMFNSATSDSPSLGSPPAANPPYSEISVKYKLKTCVVAAFFDGSIYPLARVSWSVLFNAIRVGNLGTWPTALNDAGGFAVGSKVLSNAPPARTVGSGGYSENVEWR